MSSSHAASLKIRPVPVVADVNEAKNLIKTKVRIKLFETLFLYLIGFKRSIRFDLKREPFILRGFDLGPCLSKWNPQYLSSLIKDKSVKIHVSSQSNMDFINKNFLYR